MTIIEFFDKNHIDNLAGTLLLKPEKVIFVGNNKNVINRHLKNYDAVLSKLKIETKTEVLRVSGCDLDCIIRDLSGVVEKEDTCYFDLRGGVDLYHVAAGYLYHKYGDRVQLHYYDVRNGKLVDCDKNGTPMAEDVLRISVEDYVRMYDGHVMKDDAPEGYEEWSFDNRFMKKFGKLKNICAENRGRWNAQINCLGSLYEIFGEPGSLSFEFKPERAKEKLAKMKEQYVFIPGFIRQIAKTGCISSLSISGDNVSITFSDEQIKHLLTKAGTLLELEITLLAKSLEDKDGEPVYNDVQTGVYLDWDPEPDEELDTINEIDVILMKNTVPVFISCKNGAVETDELYKLNTVAERFGGAYVRKVLIAAELEPVGDTNIHIYDRAKEMGIRVLDKNTFRSDTALKKALAKLCG